MMDREILKFCKHVAKTHYSAVWKPTPNPEDKYWDYPALASICRYHGDIGKGCSQYFGNVSWHYFLKRRIERLGRMGHGSNMCSYPLGQCAEQHACNNLAERTGLNIGILNNLCFSESVRPRTLQIFPPCKNCKDIFPTLN